ncbi:MAG: hypothetical protein K9H26_03095 [Prolixibacteraceae bacterium]|nr:hypothetical protein [Prolixibacteraceae bacterium]
MKRKKSIILLVSTLVILFSSCTNKPPTCMVFSPSNGDEFNVGDKIEFVINANDEDGSIASIEIMAGNKLITTLYSIPFIYEWDTEEVEPGEYTLTITVIDDKGDETVSTLTIELISNFGEFTDSRDGTSYKTVKIGEQVWMAENLAWLPTVSPPSDGSVLLSRFYVYGYEGTSVNAAKATNNYETYGVLYNFPAALNACPSGWHLPSDEECKELETFIGMDIDEVYKEDFRGTDEGDKLKATIGWDNNGNGTDEFGFNALPGGYIFNEDALFHDLGNWGSWLTSTEDSYNWAWCRDLATELQQIGRSSYSKADASSIRCVKD